MNDKWYILMLFETIFEAISSDI